MTSRRSLLGATAAATVATTVAVPDRAGASSDGVGALLALFAQTPVVALNEGVHHLQETWDLLAAAMFHPGFQAVDAIVVELGNSRHQSIADTYVSGGVVPRSQLQRVWRDTTQSPSATGDVPVLFRVFSLVRAINLFTGRRRPLRVLLPDPPIDWATVTAPGDHGRFLALRDTAWAGVIADEVLAKGGRCLTIGGGTHFFRNLPFLGFTPPGVPPPGRKPSVTELVEQRFPGSVSVVHTHAIVSDDHVAEVEGLVAGWRRPTVVATARRPYGRLPAAAIIGNLPPDLARRLDGLTVADLADHVLFVGRRTQLTAAVPDWEVFYEPAYWAELNRRKAVSGMRVDLDALRREAGPAMFP